MPTTVSPERNVEVLRLVIEEGFNKGNYDALDALFAPDYRERQFGLKTALEGFKDDIRFLRKAFSDPALPAALPRQSPLRSPSRYHRRICV